jgi:hypothetical protein
MRTFLVDEPRSGALRALNYSPAVERIRRAGSASARPLSDIVKAFGPAYGTVFTRRDCHRDFGVELLSQSDMFSVEPRGRIIRRDSMHDPNLHLIERGQVLIAGAGTLGENELYGRALFADGRLCGKYVGPDSMTLIFEDPDDDFSVFAYAWLASPTGLQAIRAASYGTKILRFRYDLLTTLPVPEASSSTVKRVANLVRLTTLKREQYAESITFCRSLFESLPGLSEALEACTTRSRRSLLWSGSLPSLCAWNFASGGGAVQILLDRWKSRLQDVLVDDGVFLGARFARIDCSPNHGIDFMSQRDVFMIRPVGRRIATPNVPERFLFVGDDALLVGSRGQTNEGSIFGRVELASFTRKGCGVTGDILRVIPAKGFRELAYAFLSTTVGQWLLKSTAIGTSIPAMRIDLLKLLPFPELSTGTMNVIRDHVLNAEVARTEADRAEAEAIRIIEEEVLPQWLG